MSPELRTLRVRLAVPLTALACICTSGTIGYHWLWRDQGGTWVDAIFMTVITITTIGFNEVKHLDTAGRILTMVIGVSGIGSLFYLLGAVMEYLVSAQIGDSRGKRRMQKRIDALSNHFVVAGLGRVGRQAAEELEEAKVPFVVVDPGELAQTRAADRNFLLVRGDATEDEVLSQAGVGRAKGLIVTTGNDATSIYIILSARLLNPKLFIVSRVVDEASVAKLTRAGADRAISPYAIGGRRLAHLMLSPRVVDFFEMTLGRGNKVLNIGDLLIAPGAPGEGRSLETLRIPQVTGATVLAILREGNPIATPRGDLVLAPGDRLLALGTGEQLEKLETLIGSGA